jgi:predicted enzyme related to lactoylglutathione lyase
LDRLSSIPRGQTIVHDLVRQKDGDRFVEYLTTTKGGQNMGGMMAQARGGVDLNKPTGRIYTADDLIAALKSALAKPAP